MVSRPDALILLETALSSGHAADDILRTGLDPPSGRTGHLAVFIGRYLSTPARPTRDTIRRAANAIDAYVDDLRSATDMLGDAELATAADSLADLGRRLWDNDASIGEAHQGLAPSLGLLLKRRTYYTLGRAAGFGEEPSE